MCFMIHTEEQLSDTYVYVYVYTYTYCTTVLIQKNTLFVNVQLQQKVQRCTVQCTAVHVHILPELSSAVIDSYQGLSFNSTFESTRNVVGLHVYTCTKVPSYNVVLPKIDNTSGSTRTVRVHVHINALYCTVHLLQYLRTFVPSKVLSRYIIVASNCTRSAQPNPQDSRTEVLKNFEGAHLRKRVLSYR